MGKGWVNPLHAFLSRAESVIAGIPTHPDFQRNPEDYLESYAAIMQERRMLFDVVDRVDTLSAALDRLRRLHFQYRAASRTIDQFVVQEREKNPGSKCVRIPKLLMKRRDGFTREARALVTYIYYELTTMMTILSELFNCRVSEGSKLEYLIGVRNKLLAHPRIDGFTKNSTGTWVIGPILHPHLVGGDAKFMLERDYYQTKLACAEPVLDETEGSELNVKLLRSKRRTRDFTPTDILRLQRYNTPEPDLLGAVAELAGILEQRFIERLQIACNKKFQVFPGDQ